MKKWLVTLLLIIVTTLTAFNGVNQKIKLSPILYEYKRMDTNLINGLLRNFSNNFEDISPADLLKIEGLHITLMENLVSNGFLEINCIVDGSIYNLEKLNRIKGDSSSAIKNMKRIAELQRRRPANRCL